MILPDFHLFNPDPELALFQPYISVLVSKRMPHEHAKDLMNAFFSRDEKYSSDLKLFGKVWTEFISSWFGLQLQDSPAENISDASNVTFTPGQRVRTTVGDGQILSVADRPSFRYLVKFSFGIGYVVPSAVDHLLSASDADMDISADDAADANHLMSDDIQVLFGTEKIYLFMRLYVLLVTMLYQAAKVTMLHQVKDIADGKGAGADKPGSFTGVLSSLKELLRGKIDSKSFQEECTENVDSDVYNFVAIPPLVEKCASALVKMAKEDCLKYLYQCSQIKLKVCVLF